MQLRITCVSGSRIASISVLSSSVSLPSMSRRTRLPQLSAESRTTRRKLVPDVVDRLHAGLHDRFLQLRGDGGEPLRAAEEDGIVLVGGELLRISFRISTSSPRDSSAD